MARGPFHDARYVGSANKRFTRSRRQSGCARTNARKSAFVTGVASMANFATARAGTSC